MAHKVLSDIVLSYDLGGTKVAVAVINSKGKILEEVRVPVAIQEGKNAVIKQLAQLGTELLKKFPKIKRVGMASAGPLDPIKGVLLDPTNFVSKEGTWGEVPITSLLSRRIKRPVFLENDAAAAILAERWVGAAKGYDNAMILTLGTGLGTGVVCNGELVRAGRQLHTEAGHLILNADDESAPCNCGNYGDAEAYLSGNGFARRAAPRLGNANLTGKEIADMARKGNQEAQAAFDEYAYMMAVALQNFIVLYAPEVVVLTGSFAAAADLFLDKTREKLETLLSRRREGMDMMPVIALSTLENRAGVIGGAYVAFHRNIQKSTKRGTTRRRQ